MRLSVAAVVALAVAPIAYSAPEDQQCSVSSRPLINLQGSIEKVHIARGEGTPYLEVNDGHKNVKVYLGSMRYLIEQDFRPKSGQAVAITAYQFDDYVVAATVSLEGETRTLQLRDARGFPMWRGGPGKRGPKFNGP